MNDITLVPTALKPEAIDAKTARQLATAEIATWFTAWCHDTYYFELPRFVAHADNDEMGRYDINRRKWVQIPRRSKVEQ